MANDKNSTPYTVNGVKVSKDEYNRNKFDSFLTRVPKGRKAEIEAHAKAKGKSLNGFVNEAIDEKIQREDA